jgi:hypothetical protein
MVGRIVGTGTKNLGFLWISSAEPNAFGATPQLEIVREYMSRAIERIAPLVGQFYGLPLRQVPHGRR